MAPFQTVQGREAFPTLAEKAAKLAEAILTAHPYADGNKRLAWLLLVTFLEINGTEVVADQDEAAQEVLLLVIHETDRQHLTNWIARHSSRL